MANQGPITQDTANVILGGITLTATFLLGKIVVDSIIAARKENFDRKGKKPAEVKAKETTMDGVFKVAATCFSLYQMQQELPTVMTELKKVLE